MKVIYIRKKALTNILIVLMIVMVSILYTKVFGKGTIGTFLNNEKMMPIYCVDVPDKRVALTFDAAWGDQYIQSIMEVLKRYNIKATFFVTGAWVDKYSDIVKDIYNNGHDIGNHSTTHIKMTELPKDKIINEVKETENKIKNITGKNTKLFRLPFGEYNNKVIITIKDQNYKIIQWDIDSLDWKNTLNQDIYNRVTTKISNGSIVLFHTNISNTPAILPEIIEKLRKDGYKFVTINELLLKENYFIDSTGRQKSLK